MTQIEKILAEIKIERDIERKTAKALTFLTAIERKRVRLSKADKVAIGEFALGEQEWLTDDIRGAETYKSKMPLFHYEDAVMGLLITAYKTPANVPEDKIGGVRELALLVESERFIEAKLTDIMSKPAPETEEILDILETVAGITEEFHRGALYAMLLNFKSKLKSLGVEQKNIIGRFIEADIRRYIFPGEPLSEDAESNLEFAVDIASVFMCDGIAELLYKALEITKTETKLFALKTLAETDKELPVDAVKEVMDDPSCAVVLYLTLKKLNKLEVLPEEYKSEDYISRSDLIRWLSFPSELGKAPTELEYLGEKKIRRKTFRIFRFKSDSENLSENLRGKWLIGWSAYDCGGTFSTYAEYEKYEKKTPEKTLANIAKKIIG